MGPKIWSVWIGVGCDAVTIIALNLARTCLRALADGGCRPIGTELWRGGEYGPIRKFEGIGFVSKIGGFLQAAAEQMGKRVDFLWDKAEVFLGGGVR